MRPSQLITCVLLVAGCAACGTSPSATSEQTSSTSGTSTTGSAAKAAGDPCSLLTDAEVAKLASGLQHGVVDSVAGSKICAWKNSSGIPHVQLQVITTVMAPPSTELNDNLGKTGYTIKDVAGLGDAAAVAIQQADASLGTKEAVAELLVEKGDVEVGIDTPGVDIQPGSAKFATLKELAAKAISRLG